MSQRNGFKGPRHQPYPRDRDRDSMRDRGRDRDREKGDTPRGSRDRDRPPHRRDSPKTMMEPVPAEQEQNRSMHSLEGGDDLPVVVKEKKFTNRARLFIGNLSRSVTEEDLLKIFEPFGEVTQPFIEKERSYGFIRMAYRSQAENAIRSLNQTDVKGRIIRVRFAASSCSVKVSNLHPMVSNELLELAFSMFGEVESAVVVTDERGKSKGYGIVEFAKKVQATTAIDVCSKKFLMLTKSPMPVLVTAFIRDNEDEGLPDRQIPRTAAYDYEYQLGPRFAEHNSPEYHVCQEWGKLLQNERVERDKLEQQLSESRSEMDRKVEQFRFHERNMLIRMQMMKHDEERMRLEDELRRSEQQLQMMQSSGIAAPPPPPPIHHRPPPLFEQSPDSGKNDTSGILQAPGPPIFLQNLVREGFSR